MGPKWKRFEKGKRHSSADRWKRAEKGDDEPCDQAMDRWPGFAAKISKLIGKTHPKLAFGPPIFIDDAFEFTLDYLRVVYPIVRKAMRKK